jgi:hypothetical protein
VLRLASLFWRLRRSTSIETGLFQIQGMMQNQSAGPHRRGLVPLPEWYGELDAAPTVGGGSIDPRNCDKETPDLSETLACCFLRVSRLEHRAFDLLSRYESALSRQVVQLLFMLQSIARR